MKANNTGRTYHERVLDARDSLAKDAMKREKQREANPIDWKATMETGKVVFKKTK
jgi:hypothetical protein